MSYTFLLLKLKTIFCSDTLYTLYDGQILDFAPVRFLLQAAHTNTLPFVFSEINYNIMTTLNIVKPVPPPLEVVFLADADSSSFGHVTEISTLFQDASVVYNSSSLERLVTPSDQKRAMRTTSARRLKKKVRRTDKDEKNDDRSNVIEKTVTTTTASVKQDVVEIEELVNTERAGTEEFDAEMQVAYKTLKEEMNKIYFTDPLYNTRLEQNRINSAEDVLPNDNTE